MKYRLLVASALWLSSSVYAGDLAIKVNLPQLKVAEYHRPYVAIWIGFVAQIKFELGFSLTPYLSKNTLC